MEIEEKDLTQPCQLADKRQTSLIVKLATQTWHHKTDKEEEEEEERKEKKKKPVPICSKEC